MTAIQNALARSDYRTSIETLCNALIMAGITLLTTAMVIWTVNHVVLYRLNDIIMNRRRREPTQVHSDQFLRIVGTAEEDIMDGLDLLQLATIAKTDPATATAVAETVERSVERVIRLFDIEPSEMLRLLHATSGVLSGSAVILALMPWTFEPGDLDMYVPKSQADYALSVVKDMFDFRQSKAIGPYLQIPSVDRIIWLEKGHIKLNLIVSSSESAIEPIFHFHSTLVMNFISSLGIFCAYPDLTFKRRGLINVGKPGHRGADSATKICIQKYRQRDFHLSATINTWADIRGHVCTKDSSCPHTIRTIYDSGSLFYAFRRPPWMHTTTSLIVFQLNTTPIWCFGTNVCVNTKPTPGSLVSLEEVTESLENYVG